MDIMLLKSRLIPIYTDFDKNNYNKSIYFRIGELTSWQKGCRRIGVVKLACLRIGVIKLTCLRIGVGKLVCLRIGEGAKRRYDELALSVTTPSVPPC
jgi:hypothetical protein